MAITKISQRTLLEDFADEDEILIVDKSDPTESAETGTTKRGLLGTIRAWFGISLAGEYPDIYCNAATGDDDNDGLSAEEPFLTLAAAHALSLRSSVRTTIHLAAGDYDSSALRQPVQPKGLRVVGTEFVELSGALEVVSYSSAAREITVTPDPGWTDDEWEGAFVQWVSGPVDVIPAARTKLICDSTANTLAIAFPAINVNQVASFGVGNFVRIVAPAARLIGNDIASAGSAFVGGASLTRLSLAMPNQLPTLENLDVVCDGAAATQFSGGWLLYGVRFISELAQDWVVSFSQGYLGAGQPEAESGNYSQSTQSGQGWGVACINTGGARRPQIVLNSMAAAMHTCCGNITANGATEFFWLSGSARDTGSQFPHGTVAALASSKIVQYSGTTNGRYRVYSDGSNSDFYCETGATIEIDAPVNHEGPGGFAECRYISTIKLARELVQQGSGAGLVASYGAQIRIQGTGATYGDARAGATSALGSVTRPAGAWTVGEAVCDGVTTPFPKDLSNIYRST